MYIYTCICIYILCVYEQLNKLRDPAVLNTQLYACVQPYIGTLRYVKEEGKGSPYRKERDNLVCFYCLGSSQAENV